MKRIAILLALLATVTTTTASAKDSFTTVYSFEDLVAAGNVDNVVCGKVKSGLRERGLELLATQLKMTMPKPNLNNRISSVSKLESGNIDTSVSQKVDGSYKEKGLKIRVLEREGETCLAH